MPRYRWKHCWQRYLPPPIPPSAACRCLWPMCAVLLFALCVGGKEIILKPWLASCKPTTFCPVWCFGIHERDGAKFMLILPTLRHHPLCSLCHSVKKMNWFPCEGNGNVIAWPRVGEETGKKVVNKIGPPVSPWSTLFIFFALGIVLIILLTQKYCRETHLLDPLSTCKIDPVRSVSTLPD